MSRMIHVVMGTDGEYSDRTEWAVAAYEDEKLAQRHVDAATLWLQRNPAPPYGDGDDWWERRRAWKASNPYDPNTDTETGWFVYEVELRREVPE